MENFIMLDGVKSPMSVETVINLRKARDRDKLRGIAYIGRCTNDNDRLMLFLPREAAKHILDGEGFAIGRDGVLTAYGFSRNGMDTYSDVHQVYPKKE